MDKLRSKVNISFKYAHDAQCASKMANLLQEANGGYIVEFDKAEGQLIEETQTKMQEEKEVIGPKYQQSYNAERE